MSFTAEAHRCTTCAQGKGCPARRKIVKALSALVAEVNDDAEIEASPAAGTIVFICKGD